MHPTEYEAWTEWLLEKLVPDPRVLGVVALGSMAARDYVFDEWSDHDLFVITQDGMQEDFRQQTAWLPLAAEIALEFRETAHGLKVVYNSGHLVELAVFSLDEISLAKVNRYRVLLDRADVERRMAEVANRTRDEGKAQASSDEWLLGQFVTELLVAYLRDARGEHISGRQRLCSAATFLCRLLARHCPAKHRTLLDDLDPFRRFERVYPELGARITHALGAPVKQGVAAMLDVSEEALAHRTPLYPHAAVHALRDRML